MKNNNLLIKIVKSFLIFFAIIFSIFVIYLIWGYSDSYFNSKSLPKPEVVVTRLGVDDSGKQKVKFESNNCKINYSYGDTIANTIFYFDKINSNVDNNIKPNGGILLLEKGEVISIRCYKYGNLPTTYIGFEKTVITID